MNAIPGLGRCATIVLALCFALAWVAQAAAQDSLRALGGAPALDLAAVTLVPEELPEPGYGYVEQYSGALSVGGEPTGTGNGTGLTVSSARSVVSSAGFVAGYAAFLALPITAGDLDSPFARAVVSWALEFESDAGAVRAFAVIEDESRIDGARDLPVDAILGDEAEATRLTIPLQEGGSVPVMEVAFRTGRIVAEVRLIDYQGGQPDPTVAMQLAARLLERVTWIVDGNGPRFGSRLLRVMPWDDTGPLHDRYDRWGGAALPAYGVVDTAANDIEATAYVYRFLHANGSYYAVRVANVPSSDAAANWLADWRQRWLTRDADSGYRDVTEVPVGPAMGSDDSALVAYAWTASDGKVRRGYAVAFRIGTAVVETQIHTANGLPRSLAVGLLNRQFACFAARTCIEPDAFLLLRMPGLYVPAVPAAPST